MSFPPPPPPPPPPQQNKPQGGQLRHQHSRASFPPPPPPPPPPNPSFPRGNHGQQRVPFPGNPPPPPGPSQTPQPPRSLPAAPPPFPSGPAPPPGPPSFQHHAYPMRPPPPSAPPAMQHSSMQQQPQHYSFQARPPPPPPSRPMGNGSMPYGIPAAPPPPQPPSSAYSTPSTPGRPTPPPPSPGMKGIYPPTMSQAPQNPQPRYSPDQQSTNRYTAAGPPSRQSLFTRSEVGDIDTNGSYNAMDKNKIKNLAKAYLANDETNTEAPLSIYYPKESLASDNPQQTGLAPAADSRYISLDDGNATLDFIRPTMYRLPNDRHTLRNATGVSNEVNHAHDYMGVLCTPMALPSSDHPPPPYGPLLKTNQPLDPGSNENDDSRRLPDSGQLGRVPVDFSTNREAPPRCGHCNAYVSAFFTLSKCNFCSRSNKRLGQTQYGDKVGTVDYPVTGPYITRTTAPVKPHWIFCVDLTSPIVLEYVDLVLEEIWPAFYNEIVMPHIHTTRNEHGRKFIKPSVAMVFVCSTGIYIPQKGGGEGGSLSRDGFLVMPDVAHEEAFSPQPLAEWSWSLPDEYESMLECWNSRIRPVLLPQLIENKVSNYHKNPNSTSLADRRGGYSMSPGGAALQFLVDALEETGGRAVFWTWRRPNYGLGALLDRELLAGGNQRNKKDHGTSLYMPLQDTVKSHKVQSDPNLKAAADFYIKLGERCTAAKVALDIILHTNPDVPQSFLDLATLGRLCEASSGRLIWIRKPSYKSTTVWKQAIREELMRPLYWSGWDAVFKVRCSQGLQVKATVSSTGKMLASSSLSGQEDEIEFSVVTPETCLAVTLEHRIGGVPTPRENQFAYVQTALLYTNPWTGDRRVRVSTLAIRVTTLAEEVLPAMDFGALSALQLRLNLPHTNYSSASRFVLDNGITYSVDSSTPDQKGDSLISDARHDMSTGMRQILVAHRKLVAQNGRNPPMGTLLIPDSLKNWPLFVMSASKSPLLRPSIQSRRRGSQSVLPSPRGDERAYYIYNARKISPSAAMLLVNPLLLDVNAATFEWQKVGSSFVDPMANLKNSPVVDLPSPLPASVSNLAPDGIYLLDTCFTLYVLIQQNSPYANADYLPEDIQFRIRSATQQLQLWSQVGREPKSLRPTASLPVVVVRQKTDQKQYQALLRWMELDETPHGKDFSSFCAEIQQKILKSM